MQYNVDEIHFTNDEKEYLDVVISDGYITLKIDDNNEFSITTEDEINYICKKLKKLLKKSIVECAQVN